MKSIKWICIIDLLFLIKCSINESKDESVLLFIESETNFLCLDQKEKLPAKTLEYYTIIEEYFTSRELDISCYYAQPSDVEKDSLNFFILLTHYNNLAKLKARGEKYDCSLNPIPGSNRALFDPRDFGINEQNFSLTINKRIKKVVSVGS